jgi:hypothetical protein
MTSHLDGLANGLDGTRRQSDGPGSRTVPLLASATLSVGLVEEPCDLALPAWRLSRWIRVALPIAL